MWPSRVGAVQEKLCISYVGNMKPVEDTRTGPSKTGVRSEVCNRRNGQIFREGDKECALSHDNN